MIADLKAKIYRLLRRGEKYTGTDNVYVAKGGFFLTIAQFAGSLSSLALAILYARHVPKDAYGIYQYLLSWGSILAVTSLTGMSDAVISAVARGEDRTIGDALVARLRSGLIGFAVAAAVGGWYLLHGRLDLFAEFLIVGACFPAILAFSSWGDYAIGKKRFDIQARLSVTGTLTMAAVMATTAWFWPTPFALILAFALGSAAVNAVLYAAVMRLLPPSGAHSPGLVRYGWKLTLIDLLGATGTYFDKIIVFTLVGAKATAIYSFAVAVPEQIKGYLKNVYSLALPKVANRPISEIRTTFFGKMAKFIAAVSAVIVIYILLAPWGYRIFFPTYLESVPYSQVFAISLVAITSVLPVAVFTGHKRFAENLRYQMSLTTVGILTLVLFTWKWGLWGAVAARVFTRLFGLIHSGFLVQRVFNASPEAPPSRTQDPAAPAAI